MFHCVYPSQNISPMRIVFTKSIFIALVICRFLLVDMSPRIQEDLGVGRALAREASEREYQLYDENQFEHPQESPFEHSDIDESPFKGLMNLEPSVRRIILRTRYSGLVNEELAHLEMSIPVLSKDRAKKWLGLFIDNPHFGSPTPQKDRWIAAIIDAVIKNRAPLCKEILGLTASIIAIESGFQVDPLIIDPGSGESMEDLLRRAEADLRQKAGPLLSMPPIPELYEIYKKRYYDKLLACETEGEVEAIAAGIADDLISDSESLPEFMRPKVIQAISRLYTVIGTKGSMQLNLSRAKRVIADRGESMDDSSLIKYMYTLEGGVDVGVAALKPMFVQYYSKLSGPTDRAWLFYVGMDYHYGPFSSRNMMEQVRLRDLSGMGIPIDGDLLRYDDHGNPAPQMSLTCEAAGLVFQTLDRSIIYNSFLLEKDPHYIYTEIHRRIESLHEKSFGPTPFAIINDLWMGKESLIKHGAIWKTDAYLRKLDERLNIIPWTK